MTGHENIVVMRRQGFRPSAVWVTDTDARHCVQTAKDWHREPASKTGELLPEVVLSATDVPEQLDFRFLVGLQVHASSHRSEERARRLFQAIQAYHPAVLVAVLDGKTELFRRSHG